MPRYATATWKPISANLGGTLTRYDAVILHTDAGNATSLAGWFSDPKANASCHFFVRKDGGVEQYADTTRVTYTSRQGSTRSIGVETQGFGNEPWTKAQAEAIAQLLAWCHATHGIPLRAMTTSHPSEKGVGWHRLGIDGNFPDLPNPLAGRKQRGGGELWSGSRGKECPGDDRIRQVPGIIARAQAITTPAPTKPTTPKPKPTGTYPEPKRVLKVGTAGADVRWLQDHLRRRYSYAKTLVIDGVFGNATRDAVREWQHRMRLDADGVFGPKSLAAAKKEWGL